MDIENIMKTAGVSTGIISALGGLWILIKKFNNKRFHSSCCGKDMDVVVAVNELDEQEKHPTPKQSPVIKSISTPHNIECIDLSK
jgi:hypothetical protein